MTRPAARDGLLARLRAHAGLWSLVAILGGASTFVAVSAAPVTTDIEDRALQQTVEQAPSSVRDITLRFSSYAREQPRSARAAVDAARVHLPAELDHPHAPAWGIQHTRLLAMGGEGVTSEPEGWAPVVNVVHQTGLADQVTIVEGQLPASDSSRVEVMASGQVAELLGLHVGQKYVLAVRPGGGPFATLRPDEVPTSRHQLTVQLAGIFEPNDARVPDWDVFGEALAPFTTGAPGEPPERAWRAALLTDQDGFGTFYDHRSVVQLEPITLARLRLDADQLDAAWAHSAGQAVGQLRGDPQAAALVVTTGLHGLADDFIRQAAVSRAVAAVVTVGVIACLLGLVGLAAGLAVQRRDRELVLMRARGASVAALAVGLATEAVLVVVPAAVVAWLLRWWLVPGAGLLDAGGLAGGVLVTAVTILMVPVWAAARHRGLRFGERRGDLATTRPRPARLTLELCLLLLAGLGVWLVHQRGLSLGGVDPYLSIVPALVGVAAGLLALRLYRWPLRFLAALSRRRTTVAFLGLARAGRGAPMTALPMVVLVLAVAAGGFAGALQANVSSARDAAALAQVGAHAQVAAGLDTPLSPQLAAQIEALPEVTRVAATRTGTARTEERIGTALRAVAIDPAAYDEILTAAGAAGLPAEFTVPVAKGAPLPALARPSLQRYGAMSVNFDGEQFPVTVVGDIGQLPGPGWGDDVVVVPDTVVPQGPIQTLWISGAGLDAAQVRQVVGELATVTALAEVRTELDDSAFNRMLTVALVIGTISAAVAATLVITLMMVMQAPARGRAVSQLRTMGLSVRQARGLLLVELAPLVVMGVVAGGAVAMVLPPLLGPALGLAEYTGGAAVGLHVDPAVVGGFAALVAVLLVVAVVTQTTANRRLGLGGVLRHSG